MKENINEFFTDRAEIEAWLHEMEIVNYTIIDGVVDVDGAVSISHCGLTRIPIQFGRVTGYFNCSDNKLTSLVGCPTYVGENFWCDTNELTSLAGCPSYVVGNFNCSHNKLTSLAVGPTRVDKSFYCANNKLTSLAGCPARIGRHFSCARNRLSSHTIGLILTGCTGLDADGDWADIIRKYVRRPDDIFECQAELIEQGFEEFALL